MTPRIIILISSLLLVACSDSQNVSDRVEKNTPTEKYQLGTHYKDVNGTLSNATDKHIVTEFFSYNCQHCEAVEPYLKGWQSKRSSEVVLQQSPVTSSEQADLHAKLFFIASTSDNFNALHSRLFKEANATRDEKDLDRLKAHFVKVFAEYGIDENDFNKQFASFKVNAQVKKAKKLMHSSGVAETPSLMVNGRYLILNREIKSPYDVTSIADFLIDKTKEEKSDS